MKSRDSISVHSGCFIGVKLHREKMSKILSYGSVTRSGSQVVINGLLLKKDTKMLDPFGN